jgi:hypothetical protein
VSEPSAPTAAPTARTNRTGPPWQVLAALALVLVALVVAVVLAKQKQSDPAIANAPLPVSDGVGQPGANTAACKALMPALPDKLAGASRRTLDGGGSAVAAWGDPAVVLRCGIESPQELTCSASLIQVNGVSWLQLSEAGLDSTTYIAADRSVRIAVTVPTNSGTGAIGGISTVVAAKLPFREPCKAGVLLPTDT